jgi:predicted  nucleic acid-binding Zn-ribbon protein
MMQQLLQTLLQLQAIALESSNEPAKKTQINQLRGQIPAPVLQYFDRLRARGKKGVASVRHGVCGQCHMQIAVGLLAELHRNDSLHCCENCGSYLQLVNEPPPVLEMPPRAVKPGRRGRPRKTTAHAS